MNGSQAYNAVTAGCKEPRYLQSWSACVALDGMAGGLRPACQFSEPAASVSYCCVAGEQTLLLPENQGEVVLRDRPVGDQETDARHTGGASQGIDAQTSRTGARNWTLARTCAQRVFQLPM